MLPECSGDATSVNLDFESFADGRMDSLTWYDLLPGDPVRIQGDNDPRSSVELAELLLSSAHLDDSRIIDILAAKLLNRCPAVRGYDRWSELSFRLSQTMSVNLTATGSRPLRMRAQRLNYYLQSVIDTTAQGIEGVDLVLAERPLQGSKPWDYFRREGEEWWVTSDQDNIHRQRFGAGESHWRRGLPTQIDEMPDGRLAFGSIYTPGAVLTDGCDWESVEHDAPVILVFSHDGQRFLLDHYGRIWADRQRRLITQVSRPQVHFARCFDGVVYCLDNMDFGHLTTYDMVSGETLRMCILPVWVCNDIVAVGDVRYLIDKQQGSVFKFDRDWRFQRRVLRFGRGPGHLQDPVSLRHQSGRLLIVSWLSARLTEIEAF